MSYSKVGLFLGVVLFLCAGTALAQEVQIIPIGPQIPDQNKTAPIPQPAPSQAAQTQDSPSSMPPPATSPVSQRAFQPTARKSFGINANNPRTLRPVKSSPSDTEELSDIEKYIAGKAPQELNFDIKQFGYDLFLAPQSRSSNASSQNAPQMQYGPQILNPSQMQNASEMQNVPQLQYLPQSQTMPAPSMQNSPQFQYVPQRRNMPATSRNSMGQSNSFTPLQSVPVGPDYVIGPDDEIRINVWGGIDGSWDLTVDRDGNITIPKIGTIGVTGLTFQELKQVIQKEFSKSYTDFDINIAMGQLRTIRVYVVGNAKHPGAYSVSSLSTLITALFDSGGPSKTGSMRDLQLIRNGKTLVHLDLYDFLLKGRKDHDVRLMPGDTIFIPPIGTIAGIAGNVNTPAIYELNGQTRVSDLIKLAGGVTANAYLQRIQVERVFEHKTKDVLDINLAQLRGKNDALIQNGDLIKVFPVATIVENQVHLQGNVLRPGDYQWKASMRIGDIIKSPEDLLPDTYMDTAQIDRQVPPDYHQEYLIFKLGDFLLDHDEQENVKLEPYDVVTIFNKWDVQEKPKVRTDGALYRPGEYEFRPNMKLSDLIQLSGGLQKYAMMDSAELTRVTPTPQGPKTEKLIVHPESALSGDPQDDITLQENDYLFIRTVPDWQLYKLVSIQGEVKYPGTYAIQKGEKLSSVLIRAGGLTERAYPRGAVFIRESVKKAQQAQIDQSAERLERELMATSVADVGASANGEEAKVKSEEDKQKTQFIETLKHIKAKGRMVINLESPEKLKRSTDDIVLEDQDSLYVPSLLEIVQVVGAVYNQTSFMYKEGKDYSYYINMCGGFTKNADKKSLYILKVDGRAIKPKTSLSWDGPSKRWDYAYGQLEPGDAIVVPDKLERISWMKNIRDITQIVANVASSAGIALVGMLK